MVSSLKESNLLCRGEEEESVVLCTSTHTFDVKEAETSNSLLLLPDLSFPEHMPEVRIYLYLLLDIPSSCFQTSPSQAHARGQNLAVA